MKFLERSPLNATASNYGLRHRQNGFGGDTGNLVPENLQQIAVLQHIGKSGFCRGGREQIGGLYLPLELSGNAAAPAEEPKRVYLDRPFVYMLIDCENNIPFFLGAMTDMGA